MSMFKQDYKEGDMTLKSALALAVRVLNKTMDVSKLSAEKVEIATLMKENGKMVISHQNSQTEGGATVDQKKKTQGRRC